MKRGDIPRYLSGEFWEAYKIWKYFRRFGLPNGQGWTNEPDEVLRIIDLFETEYELFIAEKRERPGEKDGSNNNRRT